MKDCEVLVDGAWLPGLLLGWTRRDRCGWWGVVRYQTGVGQRYEQARPQREIRASGGA